MIWQHWHLLRPWWLLALLPWFALLLWRQKPQGLAWQSICDSHLRPYLLQTKGSGSSQLGFYLLLGSIFFVIISCTGPAFVRLTTPTYKTVQPKVLILDMSESMQVSDSPPNRLDRAKFVLHDVFTKANSGQLGLIAFTGEPFVVSPLTDDGKTIDALLSVLTADIMPVGGRSLESAMQEAADLLKAAGYANGQILVLTADPPTQDSITMAKQLAAEGISLSVMPMGPMNPLFQSLASAGEGQLIPYQASPDVLSAWLASDSHKSFALNQNDQVPLWRDEGRWFLLPALLCLLPLFQRGRWQGVSL